MNIYKAQKKDVIDLCDMWFELQNHHRNLAVYAREIDDWRVKKEKELLLVLESNNNQIFIARESYTAIGYIRGCVKEMSPIYEKPRVALIEEVFVKEEYRKMKFGKSLVEHIKLWFRSKDVGEVSIHVSFDNFNAINFWGKAGFSTTSLRMTTRT